MIIIIKIIINKKRIFVLKVQIENEKKRGRKVNKKIIEIRRRQHPRQSRNRFRFEFPFFEQSDATIPIDSLTDD